MESGEYANVTMHQPLTTPLNDKNTIRINNDIMTRRLKNRERQRRYRARKRLEAETKRVRTSPLLQHYDADTRNTHTSVPLHQDTLVVSQRKGASAKDQSALAAIEMPVNGTAQDFASRVHSRRDWKRDARRVHLYKDQAVISNNHFALEQTAVGENQMPPFSSGINVEAPLNAGVQSSAPLVDNTATRTAARGRRHWKAEARNKKS